MENKFETEETGKEILFDWYKERGVSVEELEEMERKRREEKEKTAEEPLPPPKSTGISILKKKEERKKLQVKEEVKELLAMVEAEGLEKAIREARKRNNPFLLDVFHDVLAKDGAYKRLIER